MAEFSLELDQGNNLVSIPVDMGADGYTTLTEDIFSSSLTYGGKPLFKFIISIGTGMFNVLNPETGLRYWSGNIRNLDYKLG